MQQGSKFITQKHDKGSKTSELKQTRLIIIIQKVNAKLPQSDEIQNILHYPFYIT